MSRSSSFSSRIGIVTGIAAETRLARRMTGNVRCAGGRPDIAAAHARALISGGATSLMSFGIAGGLAAGLEPGTLIVADRVITDDDAFPANPAAARTLGARIGAIYGGSPIVATAAAKAALATRSGALAVDLESGAVARVAHEAGLPFIAIRAIADPSWHGLPPAALLPLALDGRPNLGAVIASVLRHPGQISGLITTARETKAALTALRRAARVLRH